MKKVLFLINTLNGGGAEKVLIDTVNGLICKEYDITVQTVFDTGIFKKRLSPKIRYSTIIRVKNRFIRRLISKVLFSVLGARFVYNHFIRSNYDYEIAFLEGLPTKIIANSTNLSSKKYAWIHTDLNANPSSFRVFGSEVNEGNAYDRFEKVICVSDSVRYAFIEKYGYSAKTVTLYNVIDDKTITKASEECFEFPTCLKPRLVSVGRLTKLKGYDRLLRVHKRLLDEGFIHALFIIGDGEERAELENYILENDLVETAFLLGFDSNPYKVISKCDLFVCSSFAEGYSTVVSESVLCGTPVLSTDVSGSMEPVENPRCSVIVKNSEQAIYEGIKELLQQPQKLEALREELIRTQTYLKKGFLLSKLERMIFWSV